MSGQLKEGAAALQRGAVSSTRAHYTASGDLDVAGQHGFLWRHPNISIRILGFQISFLICDLIPIIESDAIRCPVSGRESAFLVCILAAGPASAPSADSLGRSRALNEREGVLQVYIRLQLCST